MNYKLNYVCLKQGLSQILGHVEDIIKHLSVQEIKLKA